MEENLYPIYYNNRDWYEPECDYLFASFYTSKNCLSSSGGIFIEGLGLWIFPDGKTIKF